MKAVARVAALSAAGLLGAAAGYALGQQSAPRDYKLVDEQVLASIDLAKEIDSVENRELHLSRAVMLDIVRGRANPGDVERLLLNTAAQDGKRVGIGFGKDPGQAGKSQALHLVRALSGFTVLPAAESGDKLTRFGPFSSQCRAGNVKVLRGSWNEELFRVLEGFPDLAHDDEADAAAEPWICSICR